MYGLNYDGLRKKETYNELIDYVMNKQEKIKYPNRTAKFMRESPQLSNLLDGDGEGVLEMEEQQKRQMKEVEKEHNIRDMAGGAGGSAAELRASGSGLVGEPVRVVPRPNLTQSFQIGQDDSDYESIVSDAEDEQAVPDIVMNPVGEDLRDDISDELDALNRAESERKRKLGEDIKNMLLNTIVDNAMKIAQQRTQERTGEEDVSGGIVSKTARSGYLRLIKPMKITNKKGSKKGSNKINPGTGDAPTSMEVDIADTGIQNKKSKNAGSTGDPDGPGKRGAKPGTTTGTKKATTTIKTTNKKATKITQSPTFQKGGSSSSMGVVEVPPPGFVASEVKKIEAKPKAPPPAKPTAKERAIQLGASSKPPPAKPSAKERAIQLGASSKPPPAKPTAKERVLQLGASSKPPPAKPTAKERAIQLGASSKPPPKRPSRTRLQQPGVVNV